MIGSTLPPQLLPKADGLSAALQAPARVTVSPAERAGVVSRIETLASTAGAMNFESHQLRRLFGDEGAPDAAFAWSPANAFRVIGIEAVRRCRDHNLHPTNAVREVIAHEITTSTGSLGRWLRGLRPAARAVVASEAINWATHCRSALSLSAWNEVSAIGVDFRWAKLARGGGCRLRGRADVVLATNGDGCASLVVRRGRPGPSARLELGFVALSHLLARPDEAVLVRSAGLWPQAGRLIVVEVNTPTLLQVVKGLETICTPATPALAS